MDRKQNNSNILLSIPFEFYNADYKEPKPCTSLAIERHNFH